jgi:hypothetical protein
VDSEVRYLSIRDGEICAFFLPVMMAPVFCFSSVMLNMIIRFVVILSDLSFFASVWVILMHCGRVTKCFLRTGNCNNILDFDLAWNEQAWNGKNDLAKHSKARQSNVKQRKAT